jgi:hypothetical protein
MHPIKPSSVRLLLLALILVLPAISRAQTSTTGDIAGTVMDPSGAAIPNASVTLTSMATGAVRQANTSSTGFYRFSLLPPGRYDLKVEAQGFQTYTQPVQVSVNQITTSDVHMSVGTENVTVRVTEAAPLLNTENGSISTTLSQTQVQNMPNPGNDLTFAAQITPGVVMNTAAGFGNFAVNGISGTSNLFTLDGMDDNDPYLNLNNSGATNLTLGLNEIQEVTVDQNGYTGQYNSLAGSNINYITRSGTNQFHGRATYYWNGRAMNANNFFNKAIPGPVTPRSFVNANQWGGDFGGPIVKDKLFFYFDTEGLRVLLPTSVQTILPSPQFETATLANLSSRGLAASVPFYQQMFKLYNSSPGAERAIPGNGSSDTTGCGGATFAGLPPGAPCTIFFRSNRNQLTNEQIFAGRLDYTFSNSDRIYGRIQTDHGHQASFTDPISPLFNLVSDQPEWQGQLSWNHIFSPTTTNQLVIASQWYSAKFSAPDLPAALAAFPTTMTFADGSLTTLGGLDFLAPQGRNVTQVQISDDMSKVAGRQTFKFGVKYRLNYATDFVYGINTSGTLTLPDLTSFFNGGAVDPATGTGANFSQAFPTSPSQRFKFYTLGGYVEDDIRLSPRFTFTIALRVEHQSDPTCKNLCFSRTPETFNLMSSNPTFTSPDTPYNQFFQTGLRSALPSLQALEWQPRVSFAWQPWGGGSRATVLRGGFGIFYDTFPGQIVDLFSSNPPLLQSFTVASSPGAPLFISPAEPNNIFSTASASNQAFLRGFGNGASFTTLSATVPGFAPPAVFVNQNHTEIPQYMKYSFEIQQGLGSRTSFSLRYVGNRGIHETTQIPALNAFQPPTGFVGLPPAPPVPSFGVVTGVYTESISNYNGMSLALQRQYSSGSFLVNYTFSKALDEVSNGGFLPFITTQFGSTNTNPIFPQNPNNLRGNYGPADYDTRHYFNASFVWGLPIHHLTFNHGPAYLINDWQVSGNVFVRSGLPYTIVDEGTTALLAGFNYGGLGAGGDIFANRVGPGGNCSGPSADVLSPCFNTNSFAASPRSFGNVGRNSLRGPGFFDADFGVMKLFHIPHWERASIGLGAQFYNIFNHANFDNPVANVSATNFGTVIRTVAPPTTPYGSGLGGDFSPRTIQLKAQFSF